MEKEESYDYHENTMYSCIKFSKPVNIINKKIYFVENFSIIKINFNFNTVTLPRTSGFIEPLYIMFWRRGEKISKKISKVRYDFGLEILLISS